MKECLWANLTKVVPVCTRIWSTLWLVNFDRFCQHLSITDHRWEMQYGGSQCKIGFTGLHNSYGLCHLYFCHFNFGLSTFLCFTCVYESHFMCCYQGSTLWFELFSSTVYCMLLLITISWQLKTTSWQSCDGSMLRSLQVGRSSFHQVCPKVFFSLISHRISPQFLLSPFFMLCCN